MTIHLSSKATLEHVTTSLLNDGDQYASFVTEDGFEITLTGDPSKLVNFDTLDTDQHTGYYISLTISKVYDERKKS